MIEEIIAKKKGEKTIDLLTHSREVANKTLELFDKLEIKDENLRNLCFICGLLHDIGKCSDEFQEYIKSNNENTSYVYHNVLGAFIVKYLLDTHKLTDNISDNDLISAVIMYHHPINNYSNKNIENIDITDKKYITVLQEFVDIINEELENINLKVKENIEDVYLKLDSIKYYSNNYVTERPYNNKLYIISNIVKFADAIVSKQITFDSLIYRKNQITFNEIKKPIEYDERFDIQDDYVVNKLSKCNLSVFESETGFGKTMLGLLYALKTTNRKVYWVCPRNSIAESIYNGLTNELNKLNLQDKVSVGLLLTNEWKKGNTDSDIIVTNIDNFLRPIVNNDALLRSYDMLFSTVIFDEFHEYLDSSSIMALFEIMTCSRGMTNSKTLCLSATPILNLFPSSIRKEINVVTHKDEKISQRKYQIELCDNIERLNIPKGSLISVNATKTAQDMVISKKANKTLHSRFLKSDMEKQMKTLINEYCKDKQNEIKETIWSATNIISTGVDISFNNVIINAPIPNRFIQTIGRCNRWSDDKVHKIIICPLVKSQRSENKALSNQDNVHLSVHLYNELKECVGNKNEICFNDLYELNKKIINSDEFRKQHINKIRDESYKNLEKNIIYRFYYVKDNDKDNKEVKGKISNGSAIRKTDESFKFYVKFPNIDELYCGNSVEFNFTYLNKEDEDRLLISILKKYKNNKLYFEHKKQVENIKDMLKYLLGKAEYEDTPFPMEDIYTYDNNLGILKI